MTLRSPPIIGIPSRLLPVLARKTHVSGVFESYLHAIRDAGGIPLVLPVTEHIERIVRCCDGFMLVGGEDPRGLRSVASDVQPGQHDLARDAFELGLVQMARSLGKPILGVCRGMQIVNLAFGGALDRLAVDADGAASGGGIQYGHADTVHPIRVLPGSMLDFIGALSTNSSVASRHNLQISVVGDGIVPIAWSDDGVVEGLQGENWDFLGVQWHPEMSTDATQRLGIFGWLITTACRPKKLAQ